MKEKMRYWMWRIKDEWELFRYGPVDGETALMTSIIAMVFAIIAFSVALR
ncbi:MAG: hypothetical protein PUB57_09440 [Selenomonadaceae bacterium]|nr:hypothetical protein [Selenomonadaceae bacterium]